MRLTSSKPLVNSLLVFGLALGLTSGQARAEQDLQVQIKDCQEMASYTTKYFDFFKDLNKNNTTPEATKAAYDGVMNGIYISFKKESAEGGVGGAMTAEIIRKWREIGVNGYLSYPNLSSVEYEHHVYSLCMTPKQ